MASSLKTAMTAEQVAELPEKPGVWHYELVDGELVELPGAGVIHALVAGLIYRLLHTFCSEHDLGIVLQDGVGYILARDPDTLRIPDVSFIARERISSESAPEGFSETIPNLTVEVMSPGNSALELRRKIRDYFGAGVSQVWVVWPDERTVSIYSGSMIPMELGPDDTLDGGDVLPGFSVRVADLFDIEW